MSSIDPSVEEWFDTVNRWAGEICEPPYSLLERARDRAIYRLRGGCERAHRVIDSIDNWLEDQSQPW